MTRLPVMGMLLIGQRLSKETLLKGIVTVAMMSMVCCIKYCCFQHFDKFCETVESSDKF